MDNSIDRGNSHHGVGKDLIPLTERLVRGNDQAAAFIPVRNTSNKACVSESAFLT